MMRAGGGKQKGAQYERDVCVALSLWISGGAKKDLFWRSAMSGGRATVGRKKGDNLAAHAGDISATDKAGHSLTDHYYVECKRYADLNFGAFLTKGVGPLAKFWNTAVEEATKHDRIAMLIIREDRNDTLVMVPAQSMLKRGMTGHVFGLNPAAHLATLHPCGADLYHFDRMMLKPYSVPAKYKHEGPMLKPGEMARIMGMPEVKMTGKLSAEMLETLKKPSGGVLHTGSLDDAMEWVPEVEMDMRTVDDLHMPDRIKKLLKSVGINTAHFMRAASDADLLRLPNFGRSTLQIVRVALAMPYEHVQPFGRIDKPLPDSPLKLVRARFTKPPTKLRRKRRITKKVTK